MKRSAIALIMMLTLCSCGQINLSEFDSLLASQPKVVYVKPADGGATAIDTIVELRFSKSIDPSTVNISTLAVVKIDDQEIADEELVEDIVDGHEKGIEGLYEFSSEGNSVMFRALEPYEQGVHYLVVATPQIMSMEGLPLNQRPGLSPAPFTSAFVVNSGGGSGAAGGDASGNLSGGTAEDSTQRSRPEMLVINELMYDAAGADTEGDLFIELYGDAGGDISGYKVVFINGADGKATETITLPDAKLIPDDGLFLIADAKTGAPGTTNVTGADLVENFDPHNAPDCVQLLDEKGGVLDALGYGTPIVTPAENGKSCFEGTPATKTSSGQSLSRTNGKDSDDNAADFQVLTVPTPGSP